MDWEWEEERRSGADNRTVEQKKLEGERRYGEDRRALRRRVLKGIRIAFDNEFCVIDGAMKNISETGALIQIKDGFLVPDDIIIYNDLEGYKVACKVVRREAQRIGVQFIGEKEKTGIVKTQVVSMINMNTNKNEMEHAANEPPKFQPRVQRPVFGKLGRQ